MAIDPETRRRLLELVYDLLPEEEAGELRRRMECEPELAEAYAEAERTSHLFGEAARLEAPKIQWKRPPRGPAAPRPARPKAAAKAAAGVPAPWSRGANWTVALAAGILLLVSVGGFFYQRWQLHDIAAGHLRLRVSGPARLQAGAANRYLVTTTSVTGEPVPAKIQFTVFTPQGRQLMGHIEKTGEEGHLEVTVPAELDVEDGVKLELLADADQGRQSLVADLAVEPVRYATQLGLDKPLYTPGETIRYRSLTLSRFGLAADREMAVAFEIRDPGGAVVPGSELEGVTERGVGCGEFAIPPGLAGGEYALVARSLDESFPDERRPFFIRSYRLPRLKKELEFARESYAPGGSVAADFSAERAEGGPAAEARLRIVARLDGDVVHEETAQASSAGTYAIQFKLPDQISRGDGQLAVVVDDGGTRETIAKTIPVNLGKADVAFYPEGGDLVAGLRNRVYFTARDPLGKPVHLEGTIVDSKGAAVAVVETTHEGMGAFSFEPQATVKYRLTVDEPANVENEPRLPAASSRRPVVLNAGLGVIEAGKPLEFNVSSLKEGLPLVAAAWCRGAAVGSQPFVTEVGPNAVAIELDPNACGVIRLTVFDYGASPPQPIAERLVYRRPERRLDVHVAGQSERYSPGQRAELSLRVTDEEGKPAAAALGVAVVDDALLSLADDDAPAMPTHFFLATEVEKPENLEDVDFYLCDDPEAPVALDLLLGTQGWRRFAEKTLDQLREEGRDDAEIERLVALGGEASPPAMFDNLGDLQREYRAALASYRANRTRTLDALTALSFFGGLALLLLVSMVVLLKIAGGVRVWVPTVASAAACLTIGVMLINPQEPRARRADAVAYARFELVPPETESSETALREEWRRRAEAQFDWFMQEEMVEEEAPLAVMEDLVAPAEMPAPAGPAAEDPMALGAFLGEFGDLNAAGDRFEAGKELFRRVPERPAAGLMPGLRHRFDADLDLKQAVARGLLESDAAEYLGRFRFAVREYSHEHVAGEPGVRSDFAETLYWHPLLVADADGQAQIHFDLSDSVTTFRVLVDAHGDGGRIGSGGGEIISRIPFSLEPKLPLEVTAGDRIELPLAVVNDTRSDLPVEVALSHGELVRLEGEAARTLTLAAEERARQYFPLEVIGQKGDCELVFRGTAGGLADAVRKTLSVVPPGFPKALSYSGRLDGQQELVVKLPEDWVPGSLEVALNVFPSTLSDLQKGMDSMLREPCGCFEQASTSNYPNVLSLQYMQEHDVADPQVTRRAKQLLEQGYAKLTGYESPEHGYEWFGGDPGHEALSAYGLMEFRDMAEVYDVDRQMIERTAAWLLERRDGKGGFQRNPRALDSVGASPEDVTNAYVTWALSESGQEGIEKEIEQASRLAAASDDPYLVALAASSLLNAGRQSEGEKLLKKLAGTQADDGRLEGTQGSITRSGGLSLAVETTALAALAWLKAPAYADEAKRAVEWIVNNRQGSGGFGSTQATILALKALIEHSKQNRRTTNDGKVIVKRDDAVIAEEAFAAGRQEAISIEGLEAKLEPDENRLTITLTGDNQMPYALDVSYRSQKPAGDDACPLRLSTSLAEGEVKEGDTVALEVELVNTADAGQPMSVAILGLPAGLEVRPDQLDELKKAGTIDYYETRPREVICYWRSLAPKKKVPLKLDLIAAVPGTYTGPASRAYLYYTAEQKQWNDPLSVEITRD